MEQLERPVMPRRRSFRRAGRRTFVAAILAVMAALAAPTMAQAATGSAQASANYGYAGADWTWSGPGRVTNINLVVADWACDSRPVYAYFTVIRTNGGAWNTDTLRYDHSGCDLGDLTTYYGLSLSDGYNIAYLRVNICVNGSCTQGGSSGRNPLA